LPSPVPPGPDEPAEAPYTGGSGLSPAPDPDRYDPSRDATSQRASQPGRRPSPFPQDEVPPTPAAGWREDVSHTAPIPILPPDFVPADLPPAAVAKPFTPAPEPPAAAAEPPAAVAEPFTPAPEPLAAAAEPPAAAYPAYVADAYHAPTQAMLDSVTMTTVVDEPQASAVATIAPPRIAAPAAEPRKPLGDTISDALPKTVRNSLEAIGGLYTMFGSSTLRLGQDIVRREFNVGEFFDRAWFLIKVTVLPVLLISLPLGVGIAIQIGALAAQIGAKSFVGAADAVGVLREASPIVTALLLAGVGGSAVCAELGARTIREEIDAMIVLGLDPLRRLVGPLMVAGVIVSAFLNAIVIFVSVLSAYLFDLVVLHGTRGSFFGSFTQFATVADFFTSEIKAMTFGLTAIMIASYKGLNAKRGPTGVGEAVNQAVVVTGIVLFGLNLVITEIFFALVPQRTF